MATLTGAVRQSKSLADATTITALLAEARAELTRLTPAQAREAMATGALMVDIRPTEQRARDGDVPGARVVPRNVLEWRLDSFCERRVIVVCDEGYQSSLAAATLRRLGVDATDMVGGVQAWREAGLPLKPYARDGTSTKSSHSA
jgi:rhodanese-related sulfurtransferase